MCRRTLKDEVATFLYEQDQCTFDTVLGQYDPDAGLAIVFSELITSGDVEVLHGALLQWNGTSTRLTAAEREQMLDTLRVELRRSHKSKSAKANGFVERLIAALESRG